MDGVLVVQTEGTSSYRQRGPLIRLTPDLLAESWMGMCMARRQYHRRCHFHCHLSPDGLGSWRQWHHCADARACSCSRESDLATRARPRAASARGHGIMRARDTPRTAAAC